MKYTIGVHSSIIQEFTLLGVPPTCQYNTNIKSTNSRSEKATWRGAALKEMTHKSCQGETIQNPSVVGCFFVFNNSLSFKKVLIPQSLPCDLLCVLYAEQSFYPCLFDFGFCSVTILVTIWADIIAVTSQRKE